MIFTSSNPVKSGDFLVLLLVFFLPLKFFALKLGIIISFSRIVTVLCFLLLFLQFFQLERVQLNIQKKQGWILLCWIPALSYAFTSYLIACINYSEHVDFVRLHLMALRFFEHMIAIVLCSFALSSGADRQHKVLMRASEWWRALAALAILQSLVALMGVFISYESIGEPSPENKADAFGFLFMRGSSFFGEPRDLAGLVIPIFLLHAIIRQRAITSFEWLTAIIIGLLTFSSTFFLSLVGLFAGFVMSRFRVGQLPLLVSLAVVVVGFSYYSIWEQIINFILSPIPRFAIVLDILSDPSVIMSNAALGSDYAQQISDLAMWHYVFSGEVFSGQGFFGYGLGASQIALRDYVGSVFGLYNPDILFGSRFLIFIFLLEVGLFGCFLVFFPIAILVSNFSRSTADPLRFKFYCYGCVASSMFHDGYFFIILFMSLMVMENIYMRQRLIG